jgi:sensor histidine kinase regulating citrate/malate metabolism
MFERLKKLLVGDLRKQLIVGMALTVATMMFMFVWDMNRRQLIVENRHHYEQASALADTLASSSAVWVLSRDFSGLQEIVKGISLYPNLRYAIVLSLKGQVLAHNDPTKIGLYMSDLPQKPELKVLRQTASLIDVASTIMLANKQIGWVRVGLDRAAFNAEIATITQSGLVYTLIAITLSVFFASLAGRYLTRRLYAIQRVADAVQAGN